MESYDPRMTGPMPGPMPVLVSGICPLCSHHFRAIAVYMLLIEQGWDPETGEENPRDEVRVTFTCNRCGEFTSMAVPPFLAVEMLEMGIPTEAMFEAVLAFLAEDVST